MAIWPFGRSKRAKKAEVVRGEVPVGLDEKQALREKVPARSLTPATRPGTGGDRTTKSSPAAPKTWKKDSTPSRRERSRTPAPREDIPAADELPLGITTTVIGGTQNPPTSTNPLKAWSTRKASRSPAPGRRPLKESDDRQPGSKLRNEAAASRTSLGRDEEFTAIPIIPTLTPYEKIAPSSGKSFKKKSLKRKADEKQRTDDLKSELQNMPRTSPISIPPKRPTSDISGIVAHETRRGPNWTRRPNSEISLPLPESLRDAPDHPQSTSYKVSAFDILAPRPTIRYNDNPRYLSSSHGKQKETVLPEADVDWRSKARMNELADDLDAAGLRELLDRDRRRRDRKDKRHAAKLARKLEKSAEKEKRLQAEGKGKDKEIRKPLEPSSADQQAVLAAAARQAARESPQQVVDDDPFASPEDEPVHRSRASRDSRLSPSYDPFQGQDEGDDAVIETAQAVQYSQANAPLANAPLTSHPFKETTTPEPRPSATPNPPEPAERPSLPAEAGRTSESSSRRGVWASIFRRSQRQSRASSPKGRATPSESGFSNASMESFVRTGSVNEPSFVRIGGSGGPPLVPQKSFRRTGTPQRTRSKFREDLPDAPAIPPLPIPTTTPSQSRARSRSPMPIDTSLSRTRADSRTAVSPLSSPDAGSGPPSPFVDDPGMLSTEAAMSAPMEDVHPALRQELALSRGPSMRSSYRDSAAAGVPSTALLSQSLASVDSEGSWLSGRPSKRSSSILGGRPSSNSIGGRPTADDEDRSAITGSPLMFNRRNAPLPAGGVPNGGSGNGNGNGNGNGAGPSSISTQLRALRHPSQTGEALANEERHSPSPDASVSPTPMRLSTLVASGITSPGESGEAILHSASLARSPTLVNRVSATRSREGLLDIFDPEASAAIVETAESPGEESKQHPTQKRDSFNDESPEEVAGQEGETAEIKRATSVTLKGDRGHARHMSAGSARLLNLSRSDSQTSKGDGRRRESSSSVARPTETATTTPGESNRQSRLMQTASAEEDEAAGRIMNEDPKT